MVSTAFEAQIHVTRTTWPSFINVSTTRVALYHFYINSVRVKDHWCTTLRTKRYVVWDTTMLHNSMDLNKSMFWTTWAVTESPMNNFIMYNLLVDHPLLHHHVLLIDSLGLSLIKGLLLQKHLLLTHHFLLCIKLLLRLHGWLLSHHHLMFV